jgi:uncharacterized protein with FMN-binding domain
MSQVKTKFKRNTKSDISSFLMQLALISLMAGGWHIFRKKTRFKEASSLPFYKVELSQLEDGEYEGQTYTSFLHLKLKVIVENHQLKNIEVLENDGLDGETAKPIINEMIKQNKIVVPAIKGAELGSLVYISCVSSALSL